MFVFVYLRMCVYMTRVIVVPSRSRARSTAHSCRPRAPNFVGGPRTNCLWWNRGFRFCIFKLFTFEEKNVNDFLYLRTFYAKISFRYTVEGFE